MSKNNSSRGRTGISGSASVEVERIDTGSTAPLVSDSDELLLAKIVGEDGSGDFQRIAVDQDGKLELSASDINIGDVNLLDSNDTITDPATEGTLSAIETNTSGLFEPSDFTEARNVRELQNETGVIAGDVTDDTTGSSLPSNSIPDGRTVRVQADPGNSASLLVSGSFSLQPGQGLDLGVDDTSKISFTAQSSGDELEFIVES